MPVTAVPCFSSAKRRESRHETKNQHDHSRCSGSRVSGKILREGTWLLPDGNAAESCLFIIHGAWPSLYPREALAEDAQVSPEGSGFEAFTLARNVQSEAQVDEGMAQAVRSGATVAKQPEKVFLSSTADISRTRGPFYTPHFRIRPSDDQT